MDSTVTWDFPKGEGKAFSRTAVRAARLYGRAPAVLGRWPADVLKKASSRLLGNHRFGGTNKPSPLLIKIHSVEKLWKSLGESLWEGGGEKSGKVREGEFCTYASGNGRVFHDMVEKFYYGFSTWLVPCYERVLHSFHRAYYNYY